MTIGGACTAVGYGETLGGWFKGGWCGSSIWEEPEPEVRVPELALIECEIAEHRDLQNTLETLVESKFCKLR